MSLHARLRALERKARERGIAAAGPLVYVQAPHDTITASHARADASPGVGLVHRWQRHDHEDGRAFADRVAADAATRFHSTPARMVIVSLADTLEAVDFPYSYD